MDSGVTLTQWGFFVAQGVLTFIMFVLGRWLISNKSNLDKETEQREKAITELKESIETLMHEQTTMIRELRNSIDTVRTMMLTNMMTRDEFASFKRDIYRVDINSMREYERQFEGRLSRVEQHMGESHG